MKSVPFVLAALASAALANTAPTVVIQSAAMRPGTTLMDVVYRVNDPDDATVKTRALAFVDGVRSFAKVLKPVTFVEGTAAKLGDAIPSNTNHTLTWDVAADWDIDLGQVKFEVLAMDGRGLLPFDWITIPAAGGNPALTVSKNSPSDAEVLNALFWQYASGDSGLSLVNGTLTGNPSTGVFDKLVLANGSAVQAYSTPYIFKRMNLDPMEYSDVTQVAAARAGINSPQGWHAVSRPYTGVAIVTGWGTDAQGQLTIPAGVSGITAIDAVTYTSFALMSDGTVVGWKNGPSFPAGLNGLIAIDAGVSGHVLGLKSDGTVVGWGSNSNGQTTIPAGLSGVTAIAAGGYHSLALKSNGTVVAWGRNSYGETTVPGGLTGVKAIAAGIDHSLALKTDGTVVGWGNSYATIPAGLTGVTAIASQYSHSLALKSNGTVVGWGSNGYGQTTIPVGLTGVKAITVGQMHSLALKTDGTVVAWGYNNLGQSTVPAGLSGVTAIAAGYHHSLVLKSKAP